MENKGNTEMFIHSMTDIDNWNQFYLKNINANNANHKMELKSEQYLSDIIDVFFD